MAQRRQGEKEKFNPYFPFLLLGKNPQLLVHPRTSRKVEIRPNRFNSGFGGTAWSFAVRIHGDNYLELLDTRGVIWKVGERTLEEEENEPEFSPHFTALAYPNLLIWVSGILEVWNVETCLRVSTYGLVRRMGPLSYREGIVVVPLGNKLLVWKEADLLRGYPSSLILDGVYDVIPTTEEYFGLFQVVGLSDNFLACNFREEEGKLVMKVDYQVDFNEEYKKVHGSYSEFGYTLNYPKKPNALFVGKYRVALGWKDREKNLLAVWDLKEGKFVLLERLKFGYLELYLPHSNSLLLRRHDNSCFLYNLTTKVSTPSERFLVLPDPEEEEVTRRLRTALNEAFLPLLPNVLVREVWNFF